MHQYERTIRLEKEVKKPSKKVASNGPERTASDVFAMKMSPSTDSASAANPIVRTPIKVVIALVIVNCRLAFVSSNEVLISV